MCHLACVHAHLLPPLSSDRTCREQRFAQIAQADAAQLPRLPGFGLKKVARLKDAFERPFRTGTAGDVLPAAAAAASRLRLHLPATAPTSTLAFTARPSSSRGGDGVSRRMGIGVDAV